MLTRNRTVFYALSLLIVMVRALTSPESTDETLALAKYVVSIRSKSPQIFFGDNHYCIGTIIGRQFVLTAASCTMSNINVPHPKRAILVVAGTPNRLVKHSDTVEMKVKDVYVHYNYKKNQRSNIALLRLRTPLPVGNPCIDIMGLPTTAPNFTLEYMVLGWGRMFKGGPMAGVLQHIYVNIIDYQTCRNLLKIIYPETLCAGNVSAYGDQSPCAGDTGAPMIYDKTLVAIVTHRIGCGSFSTPSIYTDVWYHINWIKETMDFTARATRSAQQIQVYLALIIAWLFRA